RGFSWQCEIRDSGAQCPLPSHLNVSGMGFASFHASLLGRAQPTARSPYPSASPHCSNGGEVLQEYQPVVHRLRLSASTYGPTDPERTRLPQKTVGVMWTGFSPVFRYSYRHSHF